MHFSDGSQMDFEDLQRAVFITRTFQPVSPDWFVEAVNGDADGHAEIEEQRKAKIEAERKGKGKLDLITEIKSRIPTRPIEAYTDQELDVKNHRRAFSNRRGRGDRLRGQPCENGRKHSQADAENFGYRCGSVRENHRGV